MHHVPTLRSDPATTVRGKLPRGSPLLGIRQAFEAVHIAAQFGY